VDRKIVAQTVTTVGTIKNKSENDCSGMWCVSYGKYRFKQNTKWISSELHVLH